MKKILFLTILLVVFIFAPLMVNAGVIINEIMYDLEIGSDSGREWVEIFNDSDAPVDLTGWKFYENNTNHGLTVTQGNVILSSKGYAIIVDNPDKFLLDNPTYSGTIFDSTFSLSNDGENIAIKNKDLTIVEEINYTSSWGASGNGRSLQRKDPSGNSNDSTNWGSGTPTPGLINTISPEESEEPAPTSEEPTMSTSNQPPIADAGDNIIGFINQEIKFDGSKSSDPDGNELAYSWNMGDGKLIEKPSFTYKYLYPGTYLVTLMVYDGKNYVSDTITVKIQSQQITINEFMANPSGKDEEEEWIEIYNDSDSIVDISGWQLDDIASGSKPFVFPQNTLIAPKSYIVFSRQITGIALNNDKDSVRLLFPEGIVFQEITYEKPPLGKSSARINEGFVWSVPTPGMPNIAGVVILENKNITYQYQIKPETTKEPSQNYAILYQNEPGAKIEGGYTTISINEEQPSFAQAPEGKLAAVKGDFSKQSQTNLIFIILAIIASGLIIGLILTKFLKKSP